MGIKIWITNKIRGIGKGENVARDMHAVGREVVLG